MFSPSLRVGYAVVDGSWVLELAEGTYLTASPFSQAIAAKCFEQGLVETSIARAVEFLKPRHDAAVAAAADAFGDELFSVSGGGYFLSVLVDSDLTEDDIQVSARAAGVQLARGSAFYPAERPPAGKLFMRLPFQALTPEEFAAGTHRLAEVLTAGHR